jgi:hypothetical protein
MFGKNKKHVPSLVPLPEYIGPFAIDPAESAEEAFIGRRS